MVVLSVAVVLLRYELDKSSLEAALSMKHAMVVDAIALMPTIAEPHRRALVDAGVQSSLRSLAACHEMRLTFCGELEAAAERG